MYAYGIKTHYKNAYHSSQLVVKYTYDAWGKVTKTNVAGTTASTSAMTNNHLLYRGYYFDSETGLYYLDGRYYDPETGRFINTDNVSNLGANGDFASLNLFAYCGNNPVGRIDDGGESWQEVLVKAAVGAGVNVFTTYVAAKATGQEYTIKDAAVAAATGAINGVSNSLTAKRISAGIVGVYTLWKTHSVGDALYAGVTTYLHSKYSFSNIITERTETVLPLAVKTTSDLSFGTGAECVYAAIGIARRELFGGRSSQSSSQNCHSTVSAGAAPKVTPSYKRYRCPQRRLAPLAMTM